MTPRGYVLHADADRVVIATTISDNPKTGDMIQVWILPTRMDPVTAVRTGRDDVICGDCKHRGGFAGPDGRSCYVNVIQGPLAVWDAWQRGQYPFLPRTRYADVFTDRCVRLGAYGDPAFVPLDVLRWVCFHATRWTGYTHQWSKPEYQSLRDLVMASVDTEAELRKARSMGWRTFRVRVDGQGFMAGEINCPASDESGHKTTCEKCGLCNGRRTANDARKDISIIVHGINARRFQHKLVQIGAQV